MNTSIEDKIVACANDVNEFFNSSNAANREKTRQQWLDEYQTAHPDKKINMFSFSADDILQENIPSSVVGCSGRADLFAKYAIEKYGIPESDIKIVPMVDTKSQKDVYFKRTHKKVPDGHQIIAVKSPEQGWYLIDPGAGRTKFDRMRIAGPENINIKDKIGQIIKYNAERVYRIADILSPTEHAKITSVEKLGEIYKQVEPDYKTYPDKFKTGIRSVFNKIMNLEFLRLKSEHTNE